MLRRIALLAAAIGALVFTSSATFALFRAQTTSAQSSFTAGTISFSSQRDNGDTTPGPMFYVNSSDPTANNGKFATGLWAPGDSHTRLLNITNDGSLAGWITSVQATETVSSSLKDQLSVQVLALEPGSATTYETVASAPLNSFLAGQVPLAFPDGSRIPIEANGSQVDLRFTVTLNQGAGNAYQGQTEVVSFSVNGVQMKNNP